MSQVLNFRNDSSAAASLVDWELLNGIADPYLLSVLCQLLSEWIDRNPTMRPQVALLTHSPLKRTLREQLGRIADLAVIQFDDSTDAIAQLENAEPWLDFVVVLGSDLFESRLSEKNGLLALLHSAYFNLLKNGVFLCQLQNEANLTPQTLSTPLSKNPFRTFLDQLIPSGFFGTIYAENNTLQAFQHLFEVLGLQTSEHSSAIRIRAKLQKPVALAARRVTHRTTAAFRSRVGYRPRALIYNNYFHTAGGGERSTLDLALALDNLGFDVTLATAQLTDVCMEKLKASFGIPKSYNWPLKQYLSEVELAEAVRTENIELFVNHTFCSYMANPAPLGWYMVMFPYPNTADELQRLGSYQLIACNSHFTREYVHTRWAANLPTAVLAPPISETHISRNPVSLWEKEKLILTLGRFNVKGHNKCQLEAIQEFVKLSKQGVLDSEWRMVVAGYVNESPENNAYVDQCRAAAQDSNVEIRTNATLDSLQSLYRRASCLWQFTGIQLGFGKQPERCEHLGLVALDCYCYGVIPVVYHRGGMTHIVDHGSSGYCFADSDELKDVMSLLSSQFGKAFHQRLFVNCLQQADAHSFPAFKDSIENQLRQGMLAAKKNNRMTERAWL